MAKTVKLTDAEQVAAYMETLNHPLKNLVEQLRLLILDAHPDISERVKWNAPSYHLNGVDFLTFNLRMTDKVHLIFHHIAIADFTDPMLEGQYKDRRMVYFDSTGQLDQHAANFRQIVGAMAEKIK